MDAKIRPEVDAELRRSQLKAFRRPLKAHEGVAAGQRVGPVELGYSLQRDDRQMLAAGAMSDRELDHGSRPAPNEHAWPRAR